MLTVAISETNNLSIRCLLALFLFFVPHLATAQNVGCTDSTENTSYYRRLVTVESFAEPIKGIGPVSKDEAKQIAHFRIVSNGCGALNKVSYFHGDQPKPIDENFTANILVPTSNVIFKHSGTQTVISFSNHADKPEVVYNNITSAIITHDAEARPIRVELHDADGKLVGNALGYAFAEWQWTGPATATETRYDAAGNKIIAGNQFRFSSAILHFDQQKLTKRIHLLDENLTVQISRNNTYAISSWKSYDTDHAPHPINRINVFGADYVYDDNGYLIRLFYLGDTAKPMLSAFGHMSFQRTYSEAGNRLSYNFIDADQQRWAPPQRGYAGQNYTWREDGLVRIRTDYVTVDGNLINHPQRNYASIQYSFDSNNFTSRRIFSDASGNLLYARIP